MLDSTKLQLTRDSPFKSLLPQNKTQIKLFLWKENKIENDSYTYYSLFISLIWTEWIKKGSYYYFNPEEESKEAKESK